MSTKIVMMEHLKYVTLDRTMTCASLTTPIKQTFTRVPRISRFPVVKPNIYDTLACL